MNNTIVIDDPFRPRETFASFDPLTRVPQIKPPPGTCDAQIHVFGDLDRYPVRPTAVFEAPEATIDAARSMHEVLGVDRCVIVQSTVYGYDHSAMLDAMRTDPLRYRGVAMVDSNTSEKELQHLHDAGVRGARFNFFPGVNMISSPAEFRRCVERVAEMGWFIKVHPPTGGFCQLMDLFEPLKLDVVIDHFGRPDMKAGPNGDATVARVVDLLKRGNWWVMCSNAHRFSQAGPNGDDMVEVARMYLEAAPQRVVWGTDWPHPLSKGKVVNDCDVLEFVYRYATSEEDRQKILVSNPHRVFQFPDSEEAPL